MEIISIWLDRRVTLLKLHPECFKILWFSKQQPGYGTVRSATSILTGIKLERECTTQRWVHNDAYKVKPEPDWVIKQLRFLEIYIPSFRNQCRCIVRCRSSLANSTKLCICLNKRWRMLRIKSVCVQSQEPRETTQVQCFVETSVDEAYNLSLGVLDPGSKVKTQRTARLRGWCDNYPPLAGLETVYHPTDPLMADYAKAAVLASSIYIRSSVLGFVH